MNVDRTLGATRIAVSLAALLGVAFILLGLTKLRHLQAFINALETYPSASAAAPVVGAPLAVTQVLIGIGLFVPPWRGLAAALASGYWAVAAAGIALALAFDTNVWCACWTSFDVGRFDLPHLVATAGGSAAAAGLAVAVTKLRTSR
jgi:hypothetical protein